MKRWKQATSYVERYMAKPEEFPEGLQTGRIWGIWNEKLLPVRWETVEVSLRDAFRIRRIYRKLAKRKGSGSLRRITVFVRHENVVRLLEFLGYQSGVATSLCPSNGFKGPLKAWQQPPCPLGLTVVDDRLHWLKQHETGLALSLPPLSALL